MFERLKRLLATFIKRTMLMGIASLAVLALLMITPFWSKVLLYGLNKLPVNVVTDHSLYKTKPKFIMVLGGGLSRAPNNDIQPNGYTRRRLETGLKLHQSNSLPFVLSGVESPWMQDWLTANDINKSRITTEENSLNTCENANFSKVTLSNNGVNHIYLVTDAYHMPRARRQFARLGIFTTPVVAPAQSKTERKWDTPLNNFRHSRRAVYEIAANARDILFEQMNCRDKPPIKDKNATQENNVPKMADELF